MASDLGHWNIEAEVFKNRVEELHFVSDSARNIRRQRQKHVWHVGKFLGRGGFGEVRVQHNHETGKARAVKRIITVGHELNTKECEKELEALLEFSKPKFKEAACFVEFYGWFTDGPEIFLAMEFLQLGDLETNVVARSGKIPESEARDIAVQILLGLKIMHAADFAHRDLKPQNVLVVSGPPQNEWWIKLADFGLSKKLTDTTLYQTRSGTRAYMAPEMLDLSAGNSSSDYTNAVDMWATGCIIYRLVTGSVPFASEISLGEYCKNNSLFPLDKLLENGIRSGGFRFLERLLATSPGERASASQALQHEWIKIASNSVNQPATILNASELVNTSLSELTISDIGYETVSHDGLRSNVEPSSEPRSRHSRPPSGLSTYNSQSSDVQSQTTTVRGPTPRKDINQKPTAVTENAKQQDTSIENKDFKEEQGPGSSHGGSGQEGSNTVFVEIPATHRKEQTSIQSNAEINKKLLAASTSGQTSLVQQYLDVGADIETLDGEWRTPLHLASHYEHQSIIQLLLNKRANIEALDKDSWTPLHYASLHGHQSIVQLLLDKGANIEAANKFLEMPLHYTSLHGHQSIVQLLLDKGANIEAANQILETPLHLASENGHQFIVQLLLDKGANIEATTKSSSTPLHLASKYGHQSIVQLLLDKGANIEATTKRSWTPLHTASSNGHQFIVQLLLDKGANIEALDKDSWTPLHLALKHRHLSIVQLLLDKGANIEALDNNSWTPLYFASKTGQQSVVQLLLDKGARVDIATKELETPLHLASELGYQSIVRLLLDKGANIEAVDKDGHTALYYATTKKHKDIIKLLLKYGAVPQTTIGKLSRWLRK